MRVNVSVGNKIRVDSPGDAVFHNVTGEVGEIHGDEIHVRLDDEFVDRLATPETENMVPFFWYEIKKLESSA